MQRNGSFIIIILLVFATSLFAQNSWTIISQDEEKVVYVDTSSIKVNENSISALSMIIYLSPQKTNPFQAEASKIRTQFLFNRVTKRYTVIGTLYYDEEGKIVGETTNTRISTGSDDTFSLPIEDNEYAEKVFDSVNEYLSEGTIQPKKLAEDSTKSIQKEMISETTDTILSEDDIKDTLLTESGRAPSEQMDTTQKVEEIEEPITKKMKEELRNKVERDTTLAARSTQKDTVDEKPKSPAIVETDTLSDTVSYNTPEPKTEQDIKDQSERLSKNKEKEETKGRKIYNPSTGEYTYVDEEGNPNKSDAGSNEDEKSQTSDGKYDSSKERMVKQIIFTDGNIYCFQVSSWKQESKADAQARKRSNDGHDAFVVSADIPGKGTWYRVRIGYFNSLSETENYMRKHGFK